MNLHSKDALITVMKTAQKPIAFLVGAPLSVDSSGGVPGVTPMLDLARTEIRSRDISALPRFEEAIRGKADGDAYQAAMNWLQGNLTQDGVNRVVRAAVLLARKVGTVADFDGDGVAWDWHVPPGTRELAALVCGDPERFPGPILTTNFDPLLSLAVEACGRRAHLRVVQSDGGLGHDVKRAGEIEVIHLHGFWRGSDTLHTPEQLTAPRPRLKDSLKEILRQRTLIVAAYGGWDDVFAGALSEVALDEAAQINVLWCFRDTEAGRVEYDYRQLFQRVQPAMTRGRFVAYGGIDCHSIFGEIAAKLPSASVVPPVGSSGARLSPIAGWQLIDPTLLGSLPPLSTPEAVRYFDGAVPTWRHAISDAIPRRRVVAMIGTRLASAQSSRAACTLQLIRAAGGEGKSTLLLQAGADAAGAVDSTVLWRMSSKEGLPQEQVASLDPSRQWVIVADDADNLVRDLVDSARRLNAEGRTNVHFLLAARDADWRSSGGDAQLWGEWLTRHSDIVLRGIGHDDAKAVVQAWEKCGPEGLRELASQSDAGSRATALENAVRDAAHEQLRKHEMGRPADGSFFGGLLAVRFGQAGLQAHVRAFVTRLRELPINGGDGTLFDSLLYIAACHGTDIPGIDEKVLADLLAVPRDWVQSRIVRPLGEEAVAVHTAGHVFTRHSRVAAAVLLEAEESVGVDLGEVWARLIKQTIHTAKDGGVSYETHSRIVHAGPRLQGALPPQLPEERRRAIAITAAKASVSAEPERLSFLVDLGRTFRNADYIDESVQVFRSNVNTLSSKVDLNTNVRGYWYEWSVCEAERGVGHEHAAANAWLGGISLSDHLNPAKISNRDGSLVCSGLGVAFGRLVTDVADCPYGRGRRAAAYLGRRANPSPKTSSYLDRHDRDADRLGTPIPTDISEAVDWLAIGVRQAGLHLDDQFLRNLAKPDEITFMHFRNMLSPRRPS